MDWQSLNLDVILSVAAVIIAVWRINIWSVKRTDQLFESLRTDLSQIQSQINQQQIQIGGVLEKIGHMQGQISHMQGQIDHMQGQINDLHGGQQQIKDSISDLKSRVSHFEGLIQRRPWIEAPMGDLPPSSIAQP